MNEEPKPEILRPGDRLLISILLPEDIGEDYHQDIVFEDYLAGPRLNWQQQIEGIKRKEAE